MSTRRVLVSELVEGEGFAAVKARPQAERDRFGEIAFRFFYGLLMRERLCAGADWGAMAQEYIAGAAPTTPLGCEEAGEDLDRAA